VRQCFSEKKRRKEEKKKERRKEKKERKKKKKEKKKQEPEDEWHHHLPLLTKWKSQPFKHRRNCRNRDQKQTQKLFFFLFFSP